MLLSELIFRTYLTYTPRGTSAIAKQAQQDMLAIKNEKMHRELKIPASEFFVNMIKENLKDLPFKHFFGEDVHLTPVPKSALMRPGTLWVSQKIAEELSKHGLGMVLPCLERLHAVPKSATSQSENRPKAIDHYNTIRVKTTVQRPTKIVLIDDVVTRGATLLGCASLLKEAFPGASIFGFAIVRTMSEEGSFKQIMDPCIGTIELRNSNTFRNP